MMRTMGKRVLTALTTLLTLAAVFCFGTAEASAAAITPTIVQFVQADSSATSISVAWQVNNAERIEVWYRESLPVNKNKFVRAATVTGNSYTITGLKGGTAYDVQIVVNNGTGRDARSTTKVLYNLGTKLGEMENIYQISWDRYERTIEVGWDHLQVADGYEYYFETSDETKKLETGTVGKDITTKSFLINNNQAYKFSVRAFVVKSGEKTFTPWKSIICIEQPWIRKAVVKGKKLSITWKKVKGVDGYDVYVSRNPEKGYQKVKSVSAKTNAVTVKKVGKKKIKPKKDYYVYVIAKKGGNTSGRKYYFTTATDGKQYIAFK